MLTDLSITGLSSNLFLDVPNSPALSITNGSIFVTAPASQAAVFAAVAGAFQRLRRPNADADRLPLGPRRYPICTILKNIEYLHDTYTDSVLRACFLRAARHDELVYADRNKETERAERARHLVQSETPTQSNITGEIVLAALEGKLPALALTDEALRRRLAELGTDYLTSLASLWVEPDAQ